MQQILIDILPFTIGLIVSPVPIVALILIIVGQYRPLFKSTIFVLSWLAVSFLVIFGLTVLFEQIDVSSENTVRRAYAQIVIGVILTFMAGWAGREGLKARRRGRPRAPEWLKAIDHASPVKIVLFSTILIVLNPVNLSMLVAASLGMADQNVPSSQLLQIDAIFVVVASLSILLPYIIRIVAGGHATEFLHSLRRWLVRNNLRLTFWSTLAFAILFLAKGFIGLS